MRYDNVKELLNTLTRWHNTCLLLVTNHRVARDVLFLPNP